MRGVHSRSIVELRLASAGALLATLLVFASTALAALPPVPVPAENPVTEAEARARQDAVLGRAVVERRSIACGTCHRPEPRRRGPAGRPKSRRGQGHDRRRARLAGDREPRPRRPDPSRIRSSATARKSRREPRLPISARSGRTSCSGTAALARRSTDPLTGASRSHAAARSRTRSSWRSSRRARWRNSTARGRT